MPNHHISEKNLLKKRFVSNVESDEIGEARKQFEKYVRYIFKDLCAKDSGMASSEITLPTFCRVRISILIRLVREIIMAFFGIMRSFIQSHGSPAEKLKWQS